MHPNETLLDMRKASSYLGVSYSTLWRLCSSAKIGFYLVGAKRFFTEQFLNAYLESVYVPPDINTQTFKRRTKRIVKLTKGIECEI